MHLLRRFSEPNPAPGRASPKLPNCTLNRALSHMDAHLAERFDLDLLAGLCAMSRFHFSRSFRNTMGQSPSRWFIARRMERARLLLRETDRLVTRIAMEVGYDSPGHFAQVFRRQSGLSPTVYRAL